MRGNHTAFTGSLLHLSIPPEQEDFQRSHDQTAVCSSRSGSFFSPTSTEMNSVLGYKVLNDKGERESLREGFR